MTAMFEGVLHVVVPVAESARAPLHTPGAGGATQLFLSAHTWVSHAHGPAHTLRCVHVPVMATLTEFLLRHTLADIEAVAVGY